MILRFCPGITLVLLLGPVVAGLIGTALPAFGYLPILGSETLSLEPWRKLFAMPGLAESVRLSLVSGLSTTLLSLIIVVAFCAAWHGTETFRRMQRLLSPLLSVPHVTVAFGLAFLLAPSGWIMRMLSPWATGFERPPDFTIVQDDRGLALIAGLIVKEVPFLFLMTLAALGQSDAERVRTVARTLGYGPIVGWLKAVFPRIYPQIRLPVFAVLAYGLSVVDVALVLAPTTPPPLAVQLLQWFNDPNLEMRFVASAGAVLQLLLTVGAIGLWILMERIVAWLGRRWVAAGRRYRRDMAARTAAAGAMGLCALAVLLGLLGMSIWSIAGVWRFPDAFPDSLTFATWARQLDGLLQPTWNTVTLGVAAAAIALLLTLGCLEHEARDQVRLASRSLWLLYMPLLVPQVGFLFGTQVLLVMANLDGRWIAVMWSHLLFVLPYVFLSLSDPYRAWDERYGRTARCLGARPDRVFYAIKLPMLLRPILIAGAVGFAVSVGQYLPTVFAGAGRLATLTTEAVSLSAGGSRRVIGVYALLQMLLPFVAFSLALLWPAWLFRRRRALQVAA